MLHFQLLLAHGKHNEISQNGQHNADGSNDITGFKKSVSTSMLTAASLIYTCS